MRVLFFVKSAALLLMLAATGGAYAAQSIAVVLGQAENLELNNGSQEAYHFLLAASQERGNAENYAADDWVEVQRHLAKLATSSGNYELAHQHFSAAEKLLEESADPLAKATLLNDYGQLYVLQRNFIVAAEVFDKAADSAASAGHIKLENLASINFVRATLDSRDEIDAGISDTSTPETLLVLTEKSIASVDQDVTQATQLSSLWLRLATAKKQSNRSANIDKELQFAEQLLAPFKTAVSDLAFDRSFVAGYLGRIAELRKQWQPALELSLQAAFLADSVDADISTYRWHWQAARIHAAQGDIADAVVAYRKAAELLDTVRGELIRQGGYSNSVAPVYFGFADQLLRSVDGENDTAKLQSSLNEALGVVERYHASEIEDYYQDECTILQAASIAGERLLSGEAAIHPLVFDDRVEVLFTVGDKAPQRITLDISKATLEASVKRFRISLQTQSSAQTYLSDATELYEALIRPLKPLLKVEAIKTLVIVPDNILRGVPFAALWDTQSNEYLLQQYQLAYTPGLSLTDFSVASLQKDSRLLLLGVSESVLEHSPLPNVVSELELIKTGRKDADRLLNAEFKHSTATASLAATPYQQIHIATHGRFSEKHRDSYLLAHDRKLDIADLESALNNRSADWPLDLVTFSACQTAVGGSRTALGLTGVALRSGARSAVGSLWQVNSESTAKLMPLFYAALNTKGKAAALRDAQLALLSNSETEHPQHWSAFQLYGNWY